jgi:hypothetical protein
MFKSTVDGLLSSPDFMQKVAAKYPNATSSSLGSRFSMSGDMQTDLAKVAFHLGATSYTQRKERAIINTGLMALSELENER